METAGSILILLGAFILYDLIPPIIIGVIIRLIISKKDIPRYIPFIISVVVWVILFGINGKSPIRILESDFFGMLFFLVIYSIFIKAGIVACSEFKKEVKT